MDQWREAAHRGEFSLDIRTARRAREDGFPLPEGFAFFGVISVSGEDPQPVAFIALASLASFISAMKPSSLYLSTADGEDPLPLQDAINAAIAERSGTVH